MSAVTHTAATAAASPPELGKLAADLVWVAEDVLTLEEAAARAGLSVGETMALMERPDLLALIDAEAAKSRLAGATGQAQAVRLRDRVIQLLGAKVTEESPPRLLLDVLNAVRHVAAQSEETPKGTGFSLVVNLNPVPGPEIVAEAPDNTNTVALTGGTVRLPWVAMTAAGENK